MLTARFRKMLFSIMSVVVVAAVAVGVVGAAATAKSLSTNYTLVNLGNQQATVTVNYYKEDGSNWVASSGSTNLSIPANGGQAIVAQYFDATMSAGRGSAVVNSDQPLGAVVQILARGQVPTSGAYIGSSSTDSTYYVPLVIRRLNGTNSQIMIQNADTGSVTVSIQLVKASASPGASFTKSNITIAQGATHYYDLDDESSANVADGWFGSAVVTAASSKKISVVSNLFAGADQLQTFNAFSQSNLATLWYIPLFTSRLGNNLSTPVTVQNLSGGTIAAGGIDLTCTKDPASPGTNFTASNTAAVANNESVFFNPVADTVNIPQSGWFGSCRINSTGNVVAFVQLRQPGVTPGAAAYEAINGNGTATTVLVPLVAKRLGNGFATAVTIQNLSQSTAATVNLTYVPSSAYVSGGGSASNITVNGLNIPAGGSLILNHRLPTGTGVTPVPDGWYGTLTVASTNAVALDGFVQLTKTTAPSGDELMAHGLFTK